MSYTAKKQLVEVAKLMYQKNMVNAFEGNLSIKEDNRIYITPSGICKGFLTEEMIAVTDLEGNVLDGSRKPSSELKLHLGAYSHRSGIKSVVHAHTPYATAFALNNMPIETKAYPELIVLFDSIPLAEYGTQSTYGIFEGAKRYIDRYDIVLLANHGIMAVGSDIYDAFFKIEAAESIAKTLFLARQLGGEKDLTSEQLEELYKLRKKQL